MRTVHVLFSLPNEADGFVRLVKGLTFSAQRDVQICFAFHKSNENAESVDGDRHVAADVHEVGEGPVGNAIKGEIDTGTVGSAPTAYATNEQERSKRLLTDASVDVDTAQPVPRSAPIPHAERPSAYIICKQLPERGPSVYDVHAEFSRLGFLSMPNICLFWQSKEYEVCSTYPRGLLISHGSDLSDIRVCAGFEVAQGYP